MKESIHVEARVAMVLAGLGSGNSLQMCGEVCGIVESTTSIIVKILCSNSKALETIGDTQID
jgi:hypothetical protein